MKKRRMRDYSTDYTYGYTTGYLGMWNAPALRMKVRMLGTDYTGIFEDDGEEDKDNERTTEQRFESRRVTRYA